MRVLDPWNGSGTTTRAATTLGHYAVGFDINPVATLVASAKLANHDDAAHVQGLAQRLATFSSGTQPHGSDPLLNWLGPAVVSRYRAIE
ncbi:DNA methyltransferase, partial [Bacillus sp. SIMBA_005]